jgi:predicted RNA-binding Zn ribbon-like protein
VIAPIHPPAEERDGFKFRSGRPALDLVATVAGRLKPEPRDLLGAPADLDRWFVAAGLAPRRPGSGPAELKSGRELREAIHRLALARIARESGAPKDRALLNAWAAKAGPVPRLRPAGSGDRLEWVGGGADAMLVGIARDAVTLLGGPHASRIRRCARPGCAFLFVDTSRAGRRRWCSMTACGNKAKVAAFRRRQRAEDG